MFESERDLPLSNPLHKVVSPIPLVIRGHHLEHIHNFYYLYTWGGKRTTTEFAQQVVESVTTSYADASYVIDVLGKTPEEANRFRQQTETVVRRFVELPDDYPLELVEGVPDDICGGCAIGKHCRKLYQGKSGADVIDEDRKWIDWFVDYSQYYSENVNILTIKETATFSDAEPQEVRRIRTTVGAIRNAMPFWF